MQDQPHATLPADYYYDPQHYLRELDAVWYREWICVGRETDWNVEGDYRVIRLGDQQVIIARGATGSLTAFHNTCRHRGARLCKEESGHFRSRHIVCPYHAWCYALNGNLTKLPAESSVEYLDKGQLSLYPVNLDVAAGFVFVNLDRQPAKSLSESFDAESSILANWRLEGLATAHREDHYLECNWKVFWENFMECYHCPGVHPDLCDLVPVYGTRWNSKEDLPEDHPLKPGRAYLKPGAVTWSKDGKSRLPWFDGLSEDEQAAGMTFAAHMPGVYIVGHVDYVRTVRVLPAGPERTRLTIDWLIRPETVADSEIDVERLAEFGRQVVLEDGAVCEANQVGLHCREHQAGVLMPHEYDLVVFHDWLRERLGAVG